MKQYKSSKNKRRKMNNNNEQAPKAEVQCSLMYY